MDPMKTLQMQAIGTYSDESQQDIGMQVTWMSSDSSVAIISNTNGSRGLVTSVSPGTTTISAVLHGQLGSTQLTVNGGGE
jgi:uncharacterized protein YjdB